MPRRAHGLRFQVCSILCFRSLSVVGDGSGRRFVSISAPLFLLPLPRRQQPWHEKHHRVQKSPLAPHSVRYIIENKGITTEEDYPYKMRNEACDSAKELHHNVTISGFRDVPAENEAQLVAAIDRGPVSVAIEADQVGFQHYASGTFDGPFV